MISERQLSNGYASFWRDVTPMIDSFWRSENLRVTRLWEPIQSDSDRYSRAFINELAFELFAVSVEVGQLKSPAFGTSIDYSSSKVLSYLSRFKDNSSEIEVTHEKQSEAIRLATRLCAFFFEREHLVLTVRPQFSGCGVLMNAEGDVIGGEALFEIKAGQRAFKVSDLKQALIYCALNRLRPIQSIREIALLNPRVGIYWYYNLDSCCHAISGKSSPELLNDITNFVSEPEVYT